MQRWIEIPTADMTHQEWIAARRSSIGGSDAAAIVGMSKWATPYSVWAEKTGKIIPEDISKNEPVRLGVFLEPYVAARFTEETGLEVYEKPAILKNPAYPWAHANVDRLVVGEDAGLECKTTSAWNTGEFKNGQYPDNFYVQCVHYLAITGCSHWYLAVLIGNSDFKIFRIDRNEEEIAALMEAERNFWQFVETGKEPPMIGGEADQKAMSTLYPQSDGSAVDLFGREGMMERYMNLNTQIKALEGAKDAIKAEIQKDRGAAEKGLCGAYTASWGNRTRKSVCDAATPGAIPGFYKTTTFRQFEVKKGE